jgi:hypothetical protein
VVVPSGPVREVSRAVHWACGKVTEIVVSVAARDASDDLVRNRRNKAMHDAMKRKLGLSGRWVAPYVVLCLVLGIGMVLVGCQATGGGGGNANTSTNANANANANANENANAGCTTDAECDDGAFCNGAETCVSGTCQPGTNPCSASQTCDEATDACVSCTTDAECDDGDFCNGAETCVSGACQPGTSPCAAADRCDENADVCVTPQLFVANFDANSVTSYLNPADAVGDIPFETRLEGPSTTLSAPRDVVINTAGDMVVVNQSGASLTTYSPDRWNGDFGPNGTLAGPANSDLTTPRCLTYNAAADLLFVSDTGDNEIEVYANTAAVLSGDTAPTRRINSTGNLNGPRGIFFGANDRLYVANYAGGNVLIFNNASSLNADVAPTAVLTDAFFGANHVWDVFVDAADHLFVVTDNGNRVVVYDNAATLATGDSPDRAFPIQGAAQAIAIVVDSNDTGYIADYTVDRIYVFDGVSTINSNVALTPDSTIGSGTNTNSRINGPTGLWLVE